MEKTFKEIVNQLRNLQVPEMDLVVAIGRGGIVPGYILSRLLNVPLSIIWLEFRDEDKKPLYETPKLSRPFSENVEGLRILLVDDVSRTGATLKVASNILSNSKKITTLVINGKADFSAYAEDCFDFPWRIE